ncbi:hypothetical protein [Nocardia asteroides]|uniref:hypothetical protein n=1 Tax=Nocardia asteroides TaxID=1824 RepID=UPI001E2A12D8|nr:hypothetical protein [Nocardia asteroides]UGT59875.1 hypothetical protein LTT61_21965 [Nocardia asteroides]
MSARAIGVIRTAASADRASDEVTIATLALQVGVDLQTVLILEPGTYMPTTLMLSTLRERGANTLIAPGADHLAGAENAVALIADLVTPAGVVARREVRC